MGSFQGSKRWATSGSSRLMPIQPRIRSHTEVGRSMFLGESGSMAGGMIRTRETGKPSGTNSGMVKIAASYSATNGSRKAQTSGLCSTVSMWQRQIQRDPTCLV